MANLDGRVAVVTGAPSGKGRAMAVRFAQDGADVVVADVNDEGMAETAGNYSNASRLATIHAWQES